MEKVIGKMELKAAREEDLDEAKFLRTKSYCSNFKQNSSHCKSKGMQDQNKNTSKDY